MSDVNKNKQVDDDDWEQIIKEAGYSYDWTHNIFYSTMDAWQRKYGYCQLYDEIAAPLCMIVDCEPVRFPYGGKNWLIELWKGQYGMTTGGEIGVYTTELPVSEDPVAVFSTFYNCAEDEDRLPMSFTLRKNEKALFNRKQTHWWLTGFILGEFSEPKELVMDAAITLKDDEMRNAFVNELKRIGYTDSQFEISNHTVSFIFAEPHARQPLSRFLMIIPLIQMYNKYLCRKYKRLTKGLDNMPDIVKAIRMNAPDIYHFIINMGKPASLFKQHEPIIRYPDKKDS